MDERGTLIDNKYELVDVAGSGGMATVWRAVQRGAAGFSRLVGLKRIKAELAQDPTFRDMFVEEARIAAELLHPNIVQVYDFGVERGQYFLVMEWIDGISLAKYARVMHELKHLPPWQVLAAVAIESLKGLSCAHERVNYATGQASPVYHRDVTPQNILLGSNGVVKLTDFGLARATDRARMTDPDVIKGKVGYLAPEMTQSRQPSARTDIYALGVVLWQALAGKRLFEGKDDIEIFLAASRGEVPSLVDVRPDIPARFAAIVDRALARDPEDRYATAEQMGRLIANLLRTVPEAPDATVIAEGVAKVRRVENGEPI